ncbi:hypothetical protein AA313_de0203905 [Arthrobotrys entomopaga]|nr:hypothetical protein AA313_de0203905 [Arthrobotrys entomopaga]
MTEEEFHSKSIEEFTKSFNFTVDEAGNYHSSSNEKRIVNAEITVPRRNEAKRDDGVFQSNNWEYLCYKKQGGNSELAWAAAYNYACDRLKELKGQMCTLPVGERCVLCYCVSSAAVQLCRGSGTGEISLDKYDIGVQAQKVVYKFAGDLLGLEKCGNVGCKDTNCQYYGVAASPDFTAPWNIALDGIGCPVKPSR